ncbi:hypothetical protein PCANC_24338 [Puccinia coronata f. sp. avenae]|uniref:Uncharacterized protein n=1 Tax=Puccinia coronata f. sp. avenae TaxID=200324 RepID=A0A2N5TV66_9BASI|nr:hypothetical protein PCANC_24338 [Puccinia coronata f. sp. avenae]PLW45905.1 hypothetical protein PCASD_08623 [Puccinia coronata f. sp. avenae]
MVSGRVLSRQTFLVHHKQAKIQQQQQQLPSNPMNNTQLQVSPTASTSKSAAMAGSKFPLLEEDFSRQVMMQMAKTVM